MVDPFLKKAFRTKTLSQAQKDKLWLMMSNSKSQKDVNAITSFFDPIDNFGFQFAKKEYSDHIQNNHVTKADILPSETKFDKSKKKLMTKEAEVILLDKFREKRDEKNKT